MPKKQQDFDALFSSTTTQTSGAFPTQSIIQQVVKKAKSRFGIVPLERLRPNPNQPRKVFDEQGLQELGDSIQEKGLLQPLIIRESASDDGFFDIAAGERRWRAMQLKEMKEAEAIILDAVCTDEEMEEIALVENVQRTDLSPYELAQAYMQLHRGPDGQIRHTIIEVARIVGKESNHVDDHLAILRAPEKVRRLIVDDPDVPLRTIRDLSNVGDEDDLDYLLEEVRARRLTANDISAILRQLKKKRTKEQSEVRPTPTEPTTIRRPSSPAVALASLERKLRRANTVVDRSFEWLTEEVPLMTPPEKERVRDYANQLMIKADQLMRLAQVESER